MSRVASWRRGPDDPAMARGWLHRACRKSVSASEPPEVGDAFEVDLTIRDAHGLRTGCDRGWLIFSQGWVLFEGARTDFAVTRGESSRQVREGTLTLRLEDGRKVTFVPMGDPTVARRLNRAFNAWEVAPIPEGEAVLPPRDRHPEVWAERHALCAVGLLVSLSVLGFGLVLRSLELEVFGAFTGASCLGLRSRYTKHLRGALSQAALPAPWASAYERLVGTDA